MCISSQSMYNLKYESNDEEIGEDLLHVILHKNSTRTWMYQIYRLIYQIVIQRKHVRNQG